VVFHVHLLVVELIVELEFVLQLLVAVVFAVEACKMM